MRLYVLNDLHLEFAPFEPPTVDADAVILAGDIHTGRNGLRWIAHAFPDRPVIYVLGNHEFYGQKLPGLTDELKRATTGSHVYVLERDRVELGGVVFLGASLWTDFRLNEDPQRDGALAAVGMTDFRRIRLSSSYRRFRPTDARRLHAQSVCWLEAELARGADKPRVIVTHHAPSRRSIGSLFAGDPLNPAFASNLDRLVEASGAALWVHGHIHSGSDYVIGNTRILNNPRGYPGEPMTGFNPMLVIDV